jgi:hypothetical protein
MNEPAKVTYGFDDCELIRYWLDHVAPPSVETLTAWS